MSTLGSNNVAKVMDDHHDNKANGFRCGQRVDINSDKEISQQLESILDTPAVSEFHFDLAREEYWPAMCDLVRTSFFTQEPLSKSLGHDSDFEAGFMNYMAKLIPKLWRLSVVAVHKATGRVVGVRLSEVVRRDGTREDDIDEGEPCEKARKIISIMSHLQRDVGLHALYNVEELLEFRFLVVAAEFQRRGLASLMAKMSLELAKKTHGIRVVQGSFTSTHSQSLAEKMGFHTVAEIFYAEYKIDGQVAFTNTGTHPSAKFMAMTF